MQSLFLSQRDGEFYGLREPESPFVGRVKSLLSVLAEIRVESSALHCTLCLVMRILYDFYFHLLVTN